MGLKHVHGEDGWYAYRPPASVCRCGSCEDEDPGLRQLVCDSVIDGLDCDTWFTPDDLPDFETAWRSARF